MQGSTGRIAISGAGVGGLTLAAALEARGWDIVVFERHPDVPTSGTAISIWPNALAALDTVGMGNTVRSTGRELASVELRNLNGRPALTIANSAFRGALGEGLVCTLRHRPLAALGENLPPGTIRFGREVVGYRQTDQEVTVRLADGELVSVDALVGADGIRSAVANQLAGPPCFSYSGYTAPDQFIRNDIVDRSMIHDWSAGSVTLLGDAVHPMRPHLGQGGCQAIEDAVCLAGCLGSDSAPAAAFVAYERLRHRRTRLMVRRSARARLTYPAGWRTRILDGALSMTPRPPVLRLEMQPLARMAGYEAGRRAVGRMRD